jgi:hypothetical protein
MHSPAIGTLSLRHAALPAGRGDDQFQLAIGGEGEVGERHVVRLAVAASPVKRR